MIDWRYVAHGIYKRLSVSRCVAHCGEAMQYKAWLEILRLRVENKRLRIALAEETKRRIEAECGSIVQEVQS